MRKPWWLMVVAVLWCWAVPAWAFQEVLIQTVKGKAWAGDRPAKMGVYLGQGVVLTTARGSSVVLRFTDDQVVVVGESSSFRVDQYRFQPEQPERDRNVLSVLSGTFRVIAGLLAGRSPRSTEVITPVATMGIRGTDFRFALERGLYLGVSEGVVALKTEAGIEEVPAGGYGRAMGPWSPPFLIPRSQLPPAIGKRLEQVAAIATVPSAVKKPARKPAKKPSAPKPATAAPPAPAAVPLPAPPSAPAPVLAPAAPPVAPPVPAANGKAEAAPAAKAVQAEEAAIAKGAGKRKGKGTPPTKGQQAEPTVPEGEEDHRLPPEFAIAPVIKPVVPVKP